MYFMNFLSIEVFSLWWIWVNFDIIFGAEGSQVRAAQPQVILKKCMYYKLTRFMDCNNLDLGEIKPNIYPVNESRIKDLLLHHNGLRKLQYNVFYNLPNLISLDLSDNFLSSLDYRLFMKTRALKTLNLRNNRLTGLGDEHLFEHQKNLISLFLDFNRLKYVNECVLKPLESLETVFLFGNSLVCDCELRKTMLWCEYKKIETSAVCESPLKYANTSWSILNKEYCNKTENNTTSRVEILDSRCNYDSLMSSLNCTDVPLRSIRVNHFPKNLSLESLILQNTSISVLVSNIFDSLSSLKLLDLSNNFLESLDHQQFSKLDHLITLNLSHNNILSIPEDLFKMQNQLKVLELNSNHITYLSEGILAPLVSLEHLDLSKNRFICDCEISNAMLWCEEKHLSTGATCSFPHELAGFSWTILQNNTDCFQYTTEIHFTVTPMSSHTNVTGILLITIIITAILFLLSLMGTLWYICKYQKKDSTMIYDDICLEERTDKSFGSGMVNELKQSQSDEYGSENHYEEIENLHFINKQSTSNDVPKCMLDSSNVKTEQKEATEVASYMDMSGTKNRTRKENIYS